MFEVELPLRTVSEANARDHHHAKAKRVAEQRFVAGATLRGNAPRVPRPPCIVTLTRVSPRELDDDNLRGALKAVRDGVADALGVNDRDPSVTWVYAQVRGAYAVRVAVVSKDAFVCLAPNRCDCDRCEGT